MSGIDVSFAAGSVVVWSGSLDVGDRDTVRAVWDSVAVSSVDSVGSGCESRVENSSTATATGSGSRVITASTGSESDVVADAVESG